MLAGVLGGMGPAATALFCKTVCEMTQASCDQEHIRLLAFSDAAIPDRTSYLTGCGTCSPVPCLVENARLLERAGCDFLVMPCNTSHAFYGEISESVKAPLLDMVGETVRVCAAQGARTIGVLATRGTVAAGVYEVAARKVGLACVYPDAGLQAQVNDLIYGQVKAGLRPEETLLPRLVDRMLSTGCDLVVLGCTELSAAAAQLERPLVRCVDALRVLAATTVLRCGASLACDYEELVAGLSASDSVSVGEK